jgi:DNA-binding NtrC family response regulator
MSTRDKVLLLVDDEPAVTRSYARALKRDFKVIKEANCVSDAVEALKSGDVDLCSTDWDMPDGGGYAVLAAAKVPVVVLSGRQLPTHETGNAAAVLLKPAQVQALVDALTNASDAMDSTLNLARRVSTT